VTERLKNRSILSDCFIVITDHYWQMIQGSSFSLYKYFLCSFK